jgi:hypothetical protein
MNDHHIRAALKVELIQRHADKLGTLIVEEFAVGHGASRVDIAVINCALHGFEIKSDRDNLSRLPTQAQAYSEVFDQMLLYVGYRHAYEALQVVPSWWGVVLVEMKPGGSIKFHAARNPEPNPEPVALAIASLLWRSEALMLLEKYGSSAGVKSKSRTAIYERLAASLDLDCLRCEVRNQLRSRTHWRVDSKRT